MAAERGPPQQQSYAGQQSSQRRKTGGEEQPHGRLRIAATRPPRQRDGHRRANRGQPHDDRPSPPTDRRWFTSP